MVIGYMILITWLQVRIITSYHSGQFSFNVKMYQVTCIAVELKKNKPFYFCMQEIFTRLAWNLGQKFYQREFTM